MVVHTLGICFYEGTVTSSSKKDTLLSTSGNMPPGMFNYSEAQTNLWTYIIFNEETQNQKASIKKSMLS